MPDPLLLTHPATAEMAERMARELSAAYDDANHQIPGRVWGRRRQSRDRLVGMCASLLSDLDRPESRDAWVRWLIAWDTEHAEEMVTVSQDAGGSFEAYYLPTGRLLAVGDTEREAVSVARTMIAVGHHRANLRNNPTALLAAIQGVSRG